MKHILWILIALTLTIACQDKSSKSSSSDTSSTITYTTGSSGSTTGTTGSTTSYTTGSTTSSTTTTTTSTTGTTTASGTGNGSTCSGDSNDGTGPGQQLRIFNLGLSGTYAWFPGQVSGMPYYIPNVQDSSLLFATDARLKVRFKVNAQPKATPGTVYCYNRKTGQQDDTYRYGNLKFSISLRDVFQNVDGSYYLGSAYQERVLSTPISVGNCSSVIDFSSVRNRSAIATVVQVNNVKSDSTCQSNGSYCPADYPLPQKTCWDMIMEVATDTTQDFK